MQRARGAAGQACWGWLLFAHAYVNREVLVMCTWPSMTSGGLDTPVLCVWEEAAARWATRSNDIAQVADSRRPISSVAEIAAPLVKKWWTWQALVQGRQLSRATWVLCPLSRPLI